MTKRKVFSLSFIFLAAVILAMVWWLYQPTIDPFTLDPEMDISIVHASPGLEEGCAICHASALVADDDDCESCHTGSAAGGTPASTFTGGSTSSEFNIPHHLITGMPASLDPSDPGYNSSAPGCVDNTGCHIDMATDARYTSKPTADRDYCHDSDCHDTMNHNPAP